MNLASTTHKYVTVTREGERSVDVVCHCEISIRICVSDERSVDDLDVTDPSGCPNLSVRKNPSHLSHELGRREHEVGNLVGVKFACRNSVQHLELFDEDGIGEKFRDVVLITDRFNIHNGFAVCAF